MVPSNSFASNEKGKQCTDAAVKAKHSQNIVWFVKCVGLHIVNTTKWYCVKRKLLMVDLWIILNKETYTERERTIHILKLSPFYWLIFILNIVQHLAKHVDNFISCNPMNSYVRCLRNVRIFTYIVLVMSVCFNVAWEAFVKNLIYSYFLCRQNIILKIYILSDQSHLRLYYSFFALWKSYFV